MTEDNLPLVEPSHHILMSLRAITGVNVLQESKTLRSHLKNGLRLLWSDRGAGHKLTMVIV